MLTDKHMAFLGYRTAKHHNRNLDLPGQQAGLSEDPDSSQHS